MDSKTQAQRKRKEVDHYLNQYRSSDRNPASETHLLQPISNQIKNEARVEDEIAIIGMAGRFPDSPDIASYWENLTAGNSLIHEIPKDRWDWQTNGQAGEGDDQPHRVNHVGTIENVFSFDTRLFGISPREAAAMDPHQRVLLEIVWETFEHAGYAPAQLSGTKTGVFMAMYNTDYVSYAKSVAWDEESQPYLLTGVSQALVSNRISYLFNLQGPSEIVSTACSSALVALHKASQAIRAGDCHLALVGGVSLLLSPDRLRGLEKLGILSTAGYCAPFDANSPGEVLGEGVGVVLLKSLAQAEQDGDTIYAILKTTGTNHHGHSSGSITMPSVQALRDLVVDTYRRANIDPGTIGFIEAHGSGNVSGDMAEILAFQKAFGALAQASEARHQGASSKHYCGIGSGKGNIGFLEAAGGMAQLIKVILSLQHKTLPATINFKKLPEAVNLENSPFYIVDQAMPWPTICDVNGAELPRRAALNAYGLGGTNAHIVLEEYPPQNKTEQVKQSGPLLFVFSAQQSQSLKEYLHKFLRYLNHHSEPNLADVAYTLQVGRQACSIRLAVVAENQADLKEKLLRYLQASDKGEGVEGEADLYTGLVKKQNNTSRQPLTIELTEDAWSELYTNRDLHKIGQLWVAGFEIEWLRLYPVGSGQRMALPTYAFMKQHYPLPTSEKQAHEQVSPGDVPARTSGYQVTRKVFADDSSYLRDHVVTHERLLPATAQISFILEEAQRKSTTAYPMVLNRLVWLAPFILNQGEAECEIWLESEPDTMQIQFFKRQAQERQLISTATLSHDKKDKPEPPDLPEAFVQTFKENAARRISADEMYHLLVLQEQEYGPLFRLLETVYIQTRQNGHEKPVSILTELKIPDDRHYSPLEIQIAILDAAGHGILAFYLPQMSAEAKPFIPFACEKFILYRSFQSGLRYYGIIERFAGQKIDNLDMKIINEAGQCFAEFRKLSVRTYQHNLLTKPIATAHADKNLRSTELAIEVGPSEDKEATPGAENLSLAHYLEQALVALLARLLNIPETDIEIYDDLSDYGFDSIAVNQAAQKLSKQLKIDIPVTTFFEYTSIQELAAYLIEEFGAALQIFVQSQTRSTTPDQAGPRPESIRVIKTGETYPQPVSSDTNGKQVHQPGVRGRQINSTPDGSRDDDIAVIGMSAQFPDSANIYEYWQNLKQGKNLITDFRKYRPVMALYPQELATLPGLKAGFVKQALQFDARFFNMPDEEVFYMDPQQRLFLEEAWHAIEDAGYALSRLTGSNTGVFVGAGKSEYLDLLNRSGVDLFSSYTGTGFSLSGIPNRTSFVLGLHGPSESIDTACSSSLVAIHRAVQALKHQECDLAIAGGANLLFSPVSFRMYQKLDYLSSDWICKSFGAGGDGWSIGEGVAAVLLKPLKKAVADGDHIYAVIKGSGVIHGGQTHFYLQPNPKKHVELITQIYREAGIAPHTVAYMEAHGTGTELGDALEFNNYVRAFKVLIADEQGRSLEQQYCGLGSVKSNMGHCEMSAGVAGFIKVVLSLYHGQIPPTLHCETPNPHLRLESSPFYLVNDLTPLDAHQPKRAGVHSFNFSGGAAHAIVESFQEKVALDQSDGQSDSSTPRLICLSAKSFSSLLGNIQRLHTFLLSEEVKAFSGYTLANIAYTLQIGRDHYPHRWFVKCDDIAACVVELSQCLDEKALQHHPHYAITTNNPKKATLVEPDRLHRWIEADEWERIGRAWLAGQQIDWEQLYGRPPRRVPLPGYRFDKQQTYGPEWHDGVVSLHGYAAATMTPTMDRPTNPPSTIADPQDSHPFNPEPDYQAVETQLIQIFANVLGVNHQAIDTETDLRTFSFDSLMFVALSDRINKRFQIESTPPDLFQFTNIQEIAGFIEAQMHTAPSPVLSRLLPEPEIRPASPSSVVPSTTSSERERVYANTSRKKAGYQAAHPDAIAIIGMSGRMPGSPDLATFWQNLIDGQDLITEIPPERWDWRAYDGNPHSEANKTQVKWGGFIADVDKFDATFFKISPLEAELMDPQQRLWLQTVWHTIEDAGYAPSQLAGTRTGIFVGVSTNDYQELLRTHMTNTEAHAATGTSHSVLANRISYLLDFHGPSEPIDTACSSALVAIHRAVEALHSGSCELAIAGGVNLLLTPSVHIAFSKAGMLAEDGRCKTFDRRANGYVRSEGVGAIFLKPLAQAEADGDLIYAVIRGTAENHGGKATSLTAPNPKVQADLLVSAYQQAKIDPATVGYIEAHGTGTALGDPIEVNGLKQAFASLYQQWQHANPDRPHCGLGSVKSNIGHLEAAAGIAGVLKVLLAVKHQTLPASIHIEEQNPYINLTDSPFYLVTETQAWPAVKDETGHPLPRRAGVSSFGFGGAYAHVVLEAYQGLGVREPEAETGPQLIVLSARDEERLRSYAAKLLVYLEQAAHSSLTESTSNREKLLPAIETAIRVMVAEVMSVDPADIEIEQPFEGYGLDPVQMSRLKTMIEERYHRELPLTLLSEQASVRRVVQHIASLEVEGEHKLQTSPLPALSLANVAYTLQVGREAMEARLALVVSSIEALVERLRQFEQQQTSVEGLYQGYTHTSHPKSALLMGGRAGEAFISVAMADRDLDRLAQLWVSGVEIDWSLLYSAAKPNRISLPTYPFAKERYWLPNNQLTADNSPFSILHSPFSIAPLHPLVHRNISDLEEQRFSTTLSGTEFFLTDHQVRGEKVLPGVAYLEMARSAGAMAVREQAVIQLKDVVWVRPLVVKGEPVETLIGLYPDERGEIAFEISSGEEAYSQGKLVVGEMRPPKQMDIPAIEARCRSRVEGTDCYPRFEEQGLAYGPAFQGLTQLSYNEREALARLRLPTAAVDERYDLHPSVMDATLQATMGWAMSLAGPAEPRLGLPFAVQAVDIYGAVPAQGYAYVRYGEGVEPKDDVVKYDISLLDEQGSVCVTLKGLTVRATAGPTQLDVISELEQGVDEAIIASVDSAEMIEPDPGNGTDLGQQSVDSTAVQKGDLFQATETYLKDRLAATLKLPADRIAPNTPWEKYGIDSIMVLNLTRQLEQYFGELPKTLFFEYQTLTELTGYFVETYPTQLQKTLELAPEKAEPEPGLSLTTTPDIAVSSARRRWRQRATAGKSGQTPAARETEDIAIVGLSGRYPLAESLAEFWENLKAGRDCITEIPAERWDWRRYYEANQHQPGKSISKWGGFLADVDKFDPLFFNISPREAEFMDPQERLFLEIAWATLEDAGYTRQDLRSATRGRVGVFVGVMWSEYQLYSTIELSLGGSYASIANRVSYFLNLQGPSMAVDTMCSSSLTSVHLACESIKRGECEAALAGGVNVSVHPNKYLNLSQGQFAASDGRCRSFGQGGDGYVPGEGVGAVLLKPLDQAKADGDHIYGVIKATSLNHGGKTNGYTVPNPNAQGALIRENLQKSGIEPKSISYIEAHGTGTTLGDPIEIRGLSQAFEPWLLDRQQCAIGSVKSNVGHLESAAGIVGLTKVLLQMKHHQLVPSIHSEPLNAHINFEATPFKVQQTLTDWTRPIIEIDGEQQAYPRRAGVSSFGAGGANAHIVIEEYQAAELKRQGSEKGPYLILLSARNEERLLAQVRQMLDFLSMTPKISMADMAYTLQVGREPLEDRVAFLVAHHDELQQKLNAFMAGQTDIVANYRGQVDPQGTDAPIFAQDEDLQEAVKKWIVKGKLGKLAELWVKGVAIDWRLLYGQDTPRRISLPTYPFARERYWAATDGQTATNNKQSVFNLHPLVHQNVSDLFEQRFRSLFTGDEFFFADHQVQAAKVLPAAAYLEMARAAGVVALRHQPVTQIKDVVWINPMVVTDKPVEINLTLYLTDRGQVAFEINTVANDQPQIHSQGILGFEAINSPKSLDITAIQARCASAIDGAACYDHFRQHGLEYGSSFQVLDKIIYSKTEALASLQLPEQIAIDDYGLHPSLLDGALQAILGLTLNEQYDNSQVIVPFAVQSVMIYRTLPEQVYAYVTFSEKVEPDEPGLAYDITLTDQDGQVFVALNKVTLRAIAVQTNSIPPDVESEIFYGVPTWESKVLADPDSGSGESSKNTTILVAGLEQADIATIVAAFQPVDVIVLPKIDEANLAGSMTTLLQTALAQIKTIMKTQPKQPHQILAVMTGPSAAYAAASLAGLLKSARLEHLHIWGKVVMISQPAIDTLIPQLRQELKIDTFDQVEVKYGPTGNREIKTFIEVELAHRRQGQTRIKPGGVYWITGGLGELGQIFARYIMKQGEDMTVVLSGRSPLDDTKQQQLIELSQNNGAVIYLQADVSRKEDVERVIKTINTEYGRLNGIIHSAGAIRDSFIIKKTDEEVAVVLGPKIAGTLNIDEATQHEALDLMVLFSSLAGAMGNLGQADYAAANAFLDAFAEHRQTLVTNGQRWGQTLSINWPLWAEGGMAVDVETAAWLKRETGLSALDTQAGLVAFETGLTQTQVSQLLVMTGLKEKINAYLNPIAVETLSSVPAPTDSLSQTVKSHLFKGTETYLRTELTKALKLTPAQVDAKATWERYGLDSIMALRLTQQLEQAFSRLPKTLLFEYHTLAELTGYFVERYPEQLKTILGLKQPSSEALVTTSTPAASLNKPSSVLPRSRWLTQSAGQQRNTNRSDRDAGEIAIIGLSGRYPQAESVIEFWQNLKLGRDCITEIPPERWPQSLANGDRSLSRWGGFMTGVDQFDPLFFNISPREAVFMDPQERLFLQTAWATLEDAGYTRQTLSDRFEGSIGVFVGVMWGEYQLYGTNDISLSGSYASIANRVSYLFNLQGPSMAVDTMCSSSLTSIHLACESIKRGECTMALAGGVNVSIHPNKYRQLAQGEFTSSDGRCRSFGEDGDGYVPGEGVGAVLLKPLAQAQFDGDHIYGVIKASSVNHGGKTHGYTVPNPNAQGKLIKKTIEQSGVDPRTITYIEAHGTGTALGDPIEIRGLSQAFGNDSENKQHHHIGSVKSNIGHLEAAAGIAGLTKVLLQMKHQQLAPSLHSHTLNPHIDFADTPFEVQQNLTQWEPLTVEVEGKPITYPRRAGISSFGAGGANAHLIVEEYQGLGSRRSESGGALHIIVLSARNEERLGVYAERLLDFLAQNPDVSLADVAYTLQVGREPMTVRLAVVASSVAGLIERLTAYQPGQPGDEVYVGNVRQDRLATEMVLGGDTGEAFIKTIIEKQEFDRLAYLWVSGVEFSWDHLYGDETPHRISLPTYPFAQERYWIPPTAGQTADQAVAFTTDAPIDEAGIYCYAYEWQPSSLPKDTLNANETVLLLYHDPVLAKTVRHVLTGHRLIEAQLGQAFSKMGKQQYTLNAEQLSDYLVLLDQLHQNHMSPTYIVYQGVHDPNNNIRNIRILHFLVKAIKERQTARVKKIMMIYRRDADVVHPDLEAVGGYARSLEQVGLRFAMMGLASEKINNQGQLAALPAELASDDDGVFHEIFYQNEQRFVKRIKPVDLPTGLEPRLKSKGVYWITGGCGGLGFVVAHHLAERYQANLILTGRSALNPTIEAKLATLKALGAVQAIYHQGDVVDAKRMATILAAIKTEHGRLNGLIHAAGMQNQVLIHQKTWEDFEHVLAPKITGVITLDTVTQTEPLDFFALFSSTSAVMGDFGQCDYAIGNRFLDAFARLRANWVNQKQRHGHTISLNWPLWREGGMQLPPDRENLYLNGSGQRYLESAEGLPLFEAGLSSNWQQMIIFSGQSARINRFLGLAVPSAIETEHDQPPTPASVMAPIHDFNESTLKKRIISELKRHVSAITHIKLEQIDGDENLGNLGFDSVMLKQLAVGIGKQYGVELIPAVFFEHSDLNRLGAYLLDEHGDSVRAYYQQQIGSAAIKTQKLDPVQPARPAVEPSPHRPEEVGQQVAVAVVGISGIMPQSPDLTHFWQHLAAGHDLITEVPPERWDWRDYLGDPQQQPDKTVSKWGGFIPDVDKFDPLFFKISPREAEMMDPQHRLFLQTVWQCLEDAGYRASDLSGQAVGVYVGVQFQEYHDLIKELKIEPNAQMGTGNAHALLVNRISYLLNLRGPSEAIDTACSSSLVAVHRAVRSITSGEIDSAIVGGVNLALSPWTYVATGHMGVLSPDGRCKTFDKAANGYVKGEGVGAMLLKPLTQALQDGDTIYGVIRGSAVNHGGRANSLTAPNSQAQAQLLVTAYQEAGIEPETVTYLETHGTGTELGDPVEIEGLKRAFAMLSHQRDNADTPYYYCGLGSVKTNIGHLEPAAGIAGLLKVLLAMKYKTLPATINFTEQNPYIELKDTPFYLVTKTQDWRPLVDAQGITIPRRAGVSSFGFGGTYAHVVVEEYQQPEVKHAASGESDQHLIVLSAKNEKRLRVYAEKMLDFLSPNSDNSHDRENNETTSLHQELTEIAAKIIGVRSAEIDPEQPLTDYGFDPVQFSRLKEIIEAEYQCNVPMTLFSGETSLLDLADNLCQIDPGLIRQIHGADDEDSTQTHVDMPVAPTISLREMAYTLQVGREAMNSRLALVVQDTVTLRQKLTSYLAGETDIVHCYQGEVRQNKAILDNFADDDDAQTLINRWIEKGKLEKLADLWVKGLDIDWSLLYHEPKPNRIPLPTYPFAKERYWLPNNGQFSILHSPFSIDMLHPLLHQNTSTLTEQRFSSVFSGEEFFLNDHRVQGKSVLPGVAYLEMARAAGQIALDGQPIIQIKNVIWAGPIVLDNKPITVQTTLHPSSGEQVAFEMSTLQQGKQVVHAQGKMRWGNAPSGAPVIDLDAIRARCKTKSSRESCYTLFQQQGLDYGSTFQVIDALISNENEALARLTLLPRLSGDSSYLLHPALMDGALQAIIGLVPQPLRATKPGLYLPFAVQTVDIFSSLPDTVYTYVQYSHGAKSDNKSSSVKYDITVTDEVGRSCVQLTGFTMRAVPETSMVSGVEPKHAILYGTPSWQAIPLIDHNGKSTAEDGHNTLLLVAGEEPGKLEAIKKRFNQANVVVLPKPSHNIAADAITLTQLGLTHLKSIAETKPSAPHRILVVVIDTEYRYRIAPLIGLLKTAQLEHPKLTGKIVTAPHLDIDNLTSVLNREMAADTLQQTEVRYDEVGARFVKTVSEIQPDPAAPPRTTVRSGGVYWITGGMGGLGRIFARYLIEQGSSMTLILSGRSALDDAIQQQLVDLNHNGATIEYIQADISQPDDVEQTVKAIKARYGQIHGIIHCAGVIKDNFIIKKSSADIAAVLAPKVAGIINIDRATQTEKLDFMILFSSIAGVFGNVGQADYAAANAFLDAFAHYRHDLVTRGRRYGQTLSINWPLWVEGGMQVDEQVLSLLERRTGMQPLSSAQGVAVFEQLLGHHEHKQVLVATGDIAKIRRSWGAVLAAPQPPRPGQGGDDASTAATVSMRASDSGQPAPAQIESSLIELFVSLLKVNPADLDTETNFADYGVDSIMMMSMLNRLEERYGITIDPNAIMEHPTISVLADYLQEMGLTGSSPISQNSVEVNETDQSQIVPTHGIPSFRLQPDYRFNQIIAPQGSGQVAIIGQVCRLPQSPTLERFWGNLAAGRDLVTPLVTDRWAIEPDQRELISAPFGAFIDNIEYFDAGFFGISEMDALTIDPQHRIALEMAQELWDRAGYSSAEVNGTNTSVFIGARESNYLRNSFHFVPEAAAQRGVVNSINNMVAARISDFYNLKGASQVLDTACSSSLVAVHDACQSVLRGESELAIAGGIFLMVDAFSHIGFSQAQVLSPDGKSYVFDERAQGFVLGEGGGLVLLKEYEAALRDGDQILGVILGSAINNDGHTMGLTVPNQAGQKAVIEAALKRSRITPDQISYLEAHGTGTLLGDPIEIKAATEVYRRYTDDKQYCAVGSVKSNLGHTMTAAGVTGLLKLLLSLQHRQIPATLHCDTPHPRFKFAESPFYPNTRLQNWQPRHGRRIGAISSFGFGGTNCHAIIEEGHQPHPHRQPLPRTQFKRKRYWLGKEITPEVTDSFDEAYYATLIERLQSESLSEESFKTLLLNE